MTKVSIIPVSQLVVYIMEPQFQALKIDIRNKPKLLKSVSASWCIVHDRYTVVCTTAKSLYISCFGFNSR